MVHGVKCEEMGSVQSPVSLKDDASFSGWHYVLEKFVFCRLTRWKNYPRTNFLFTRACMIVAAITIAIAVPCMTGLFIGYLLHTKDAVDFFISFKDAWPTYLARFTFGYFSAISVLFWNLEREFKGRLMYCISVYNDSLKCTATGTDDVKELSSLKRDLLSNSLAIDLLYFDLWAHYSLKELFSQELEDSIRDCYQQGIATEDAIQRVNSGLMGEIEASRLLHNRQSLLLSKEEKVLSSRTHAREVSGTKVVAMATKKRGSGT
jgi:hypothetical protein